MKTKLNLTLDSKLIPRSKQFAKKKGKSVSQIVEDLLKKALQEEKISFSEKWLGKFTLTNETDKRLEYLKNRYQI